ncbi:hypothetical protein COCC4DRAFT_132303, partial [Bipolaris maydis ATCC 48331]
ITVTIQARLEGLISAVVRLRGIRECVGQQKNLDSRQNTYRPCTKGYQKSTEQLQSLCLL